MLKCWRPNSEIEKRGSRGYKIPLETNYPAGCIASRKHASWRWRAVWIDAQQPFFETESAGGKLAASGLVR